MKLKIQKSTLKGELPEIYSKSYSHRYLIGSFLSGMTFKFEDDFSKSDDIKATENALAVMENFSKTSNKIPRFYCNNSGTTLRMIVPLAMVFYQKAEFICSDQLIRRNILDSLEKLSNFGIDISVIESEDKSESNSENKVIAKGNLNSSFVNFGYCETSQLISGLLMTLPLLKDNSLIAIPRDFQSLPYIEMTLKTLEDFNVEIHKVAFTDKKSFLDTYSHFFQIEKESDKLKAFFKTSKPLQNGDLVFVIKGGQKYKTLPNIKEHIENDWSNSAFWIVGNYLLHHMENHIISDVFQLLEKPIKLPRLSLDSLQGDREILNILQNFDSGCDYDIANDKGYATSKEKYQRDEILEINCMNIPDIVPILALASVVRYNKKTMFANLERLAIKESNRIKSTVDILKALNIDVDFNNNSLTVTSLKRHNKSDTASNIMEPIKIKTYGDHRIAMTATIASLISRKPIIIDDFNCVEKSYPRFFSDFKKLGGHYDKI